MKIQRWNEDGPLSPDGHVLTPAEADEYWRGALAAALPLALRRQCVGCCDRPAEGDGYTCGHAACIAVWADWPPHIRAELEERCRIGDRRLRTALWQWAASVAGIVVLFGLVMGGTIWFLVALVNRFGRVMG